LNQLTKYKEESVSAPTDTDCMKNDVESFAHFSTSQKNTCNYSITQPQRKSTENCKIFETDLFSQVKISLDLAVVVDYYGVQVNSKNFALCPFHSEKTPSFKIDVNNNTYHCFGCGEHGTVIDFVMKYFGLSNIDAVRKLNQDFRLNLMSEVKPVRAANCRLIQENKNLIADFEKWEKQAFITLSSYFRALRFWGEQIFIHHIKYFNKYLPEVENIVFVETMLDLMIDNIHDFPSQVEFYRTYGEAVTAIEHRLK